MTTSAGINPTGVGSGGGLYVSTSPLGPIALASMGGNTANAIALWLTEIFIPCNRFATTIGILQGGTAGTDKIIGVIYDSTGALVGTSALAGTALNGSANTFLEVSIVLNGAGATVPGVQLYGPGQYFVGFQGNGTAAGAIQTYSAPYQMICNQVTAGVFATIPASIAVPTTFNSGKGPIAYIK